MNLNPAEASDPHRVWTPAGRAGRLVEREHGFSVLLTRRSDSLRSHTGQIAFPGGRSDPGETQWETEAARGPRGDRARPRLRRAGRAFRRPTAPPCTGYRQIMPVVGFVSADMRLTPNPDEVADIFETLFGFLMDPNNLRTAPGARDPRRRAPPLLRRPPGKAKG